MVDGDDAGEPVERHQRADILGVARAMYGSDEIEIDDDANVVHAEDAYWVAAYVRVPHSDINAVRAG